MATLNSVHLIGNAGSDAEVKYLESGKKVARFQLATSRYYKDASGTSQQVTDWHTIQAWGSLADFCEKYVRKGQCYFVSGEIRTEAYQDAQGVKKYITKIAAVNIQFAGPKPAGEPQPQQAQTRPMQPARVPLYQQAAQAPANPQPEGDDLSF